MKIYVADFWVDTFGERIEWLFHPVPCLAEDILAHKVCMFVSCCTSPAVFPAPLRPVQICIPMDREEEVRRHFLGFRKLFADFRMNLQ